MGDRLFGDLRGRALGVVAGCLICQMGLGFGYVFGPLARDIISEFEWTRAMYSSARAPQLWVLAGASPIVGAMVVRYGVRPILTLATFTIGICFLLFSQIQSLAHMTALVMLTGLALTGVGDITVGQAVNQWVERGRGLALGIVYTGSNIGGWLLVPIAVGIADRESWREALFSMGVGALLVMVPVAYWVVRAPRPGETARPGQAPDRIAAAAAGADGDLAVSAALRTRSFWILAFALFTFFFYFLGMLDCLVLFLTDEGMARSEATAWFSSAIGLGMVSKIALGALADRIPYKRAMLVDYSLLALSSFVLLALPAEDALMWVFIASYGFATAARDVVYPLMINSCFGVRHMAAVYGALMLALIPGGTLGPIYAAAIHDHFQSYDIAFATFAALNALALAALLGLRDERGRAAGAAA